MGVFGSRENDPLINHDPFAPLPNEESGSSGEEGGERESSPTKDSASSVFRPEESQTDRESQASPSESTWVVTRSLDEAADGRLADLNAAFEQGWQLSSVELRVGTEDEHSSGISVAFVLRE
jgi:hypothetical protein